MARQERSAGKKSLSVLVIGARKSSAASSLNAMNTEGAGIHGAATSQRPNGVMRVMAQTNATA